MPKMNDEDFENITTRMAGEMALWFTEKQGKTPQDSLSEDDYAIRLVASCKLVAALIFTGAIDAAGPKNNHLLMDLLDSAQNAFRMDLKSSIMRMYERKDSPTWTLDEAMSFIKGGRS